MYTNLFKTKTEKVIDGKMDVNPSGSTGIQSSLANVISDLVNSVPVSFNGQQSTTDWSHLDQAQSGLILKIRDPKSKKPLTIWNPRLTENLMSNDGGKTTVTGDSSNGLTLFDCIHMGNHLDSVVVLGGLRTTSTVDSTVGSAQSLTPSASAANTEVKSSMVLPLDPHSSSATIIPDGTKTSSNFFPTIDFSGLANNLPSIAKNQIDMVNGLLHPSLSFLPQNTSAPSSPSSGDLKSVLSDKMGITNPDGSTKQVGKPNTSIMAPNNTLTGTIPYRSTTKSLLHVTHP